MARLIQDYWAKQGVEISLTCDPTKDLRAILGPGALPRGYDGEDGRMIAEADGRFLGASPSEKRELKERYGMPVELPAAGASPERWRGVPGEHENPFGGDGYGALGSPLAARSAVAQRGKCRRGPL